MKNTLAVIGAQWGDEGKGKITDVIAQRADVVVRYQGGNNAGHTIKFNGKSYALKLIPSGSFSNTVKNVMANGMVINPKAFIEELKMLKDNGFNPKLFISDRAHVILPFHMEMDSIREDMRGDNKIGTTKKGIGPTYEDKASRSGIRVGDLLHAESLKTKIDAIVNTRNFWLKGSNNIQADANEVFNEYVQYGKIMAEYICDTSLLLNREIQDGSKVLFEGAQGIMLCIDHGTYPMVTSSSPTAAAIPLYCGIAPRYIHDVLGIVKAYTTRVGSGPFPSEIEGPIAETIRTVGREFGTVTGRPRRIGWLDTMLLSHSKRVSGLTHMSVMLLDVLTGIKTLKICVAYKLDGEIINYMPGSIEQFEKVEPVYVEMPGWEEDLTEVTTWEGLPKNAQEYLKKIEELTELELALFSVGPDREQTIELIKLLD